MPGDRERDSGKPGGGKGRKDEVGRTGIYPASGPYPPGDAEVRGQGELAHPEERGRSGARPQPAEEPPDREPAE